MERLADAVRGELVALRRAGRRSAALADAWPAAVGEQIARNAWPARIARDGTLHVNTSSSAWAFELAQLEAAIREKLGDSGAGEGPVRAGPVAGAANDRRRRVLRRPHRSRLTTTVSRGSANSRPRSATKSYGIWLRARPRRASRAAGTAALSDTLPAARKAGICRAFSLWQRRLTPQRTSRSSKASTRSGKRPGMYIGSTGCARPPPPRLRGGRQRRRRGAGRPQRPRRGDAPPGQLGHGSRLGLGDPGRHHEGPGPPRPHRRPDEAARRRQVRPGRLQGLRRPARRRRLGRQRALGVADRRGAARRQDLPPGVRARRAAGRDAEGRRLDRRRARRSRSCPTRRSSRSSSTRPTR